VSAVPLSRNSFYWISVIVLTLAACTKISTGADVTANNAPTQMRTHCLGRLLLELPDDFEQTLGSDVEFTYGLDKSFRRTKIELSGVANRGSVLREAAAREIAKLTSLQHSRSASKNMLSMSRAPSADIVLIRAFDEPGMLEYLTAIAFVEKMSAVARIARHIDKGEPPESVEAHLLEVAARTTFIPNPSALKQKGTCFGPLLIDAGQDGESFTVAFKSSQMPDVKISFDINSLVATSDGGLFKRLDKKAGLLAQAGFGPNSYRKRDVKIDGRPAQEVSRTGKERDKVVRQFIAEVVMDKPATFAAPMIAINLSMGGQVGPEDYRDASMSEAAAMAMWESILKSIRLRPGAL
jgi:Tle cognate immunity protein 4 C-terminal domain